MDSTTSRLSRMERALRALSMAVNESPVGKRAQHLYHNVVSLPWMRFAIAKRTFAHNFDRLVNLDPDRGVMLVSNHRSFFDMYTTLLGLYMARSEWLRAMYFPVRSEFFYDRPAGAMVNFAIGGGAMYPPIYRDRAKAALNDDALERLKSFLSERGVVVGMHPEGTRNKTDDPYTLLPAQPGVGKVILQSRPIVIPFFIHGLGNDLVKDIRDTQNPAMRRERPVIINMGEPFDYSEFTEQKPRLTLYKRVADRVAEKIVELGAEERELRQRIGRGELDDSPFWYENIRAGSLRG